MNECMSSHSLFASYRCRSIVFHTGKDILLSVELVGDVKAIVGSPLSLVL